MATDEIPKFVLEKHPEMVRVGEALELFRKGEPVTTICLICGQPLIVTHIEVTGVIDIRCKTGCTKFRAKGDL
jgi:hypothetical protein